MIKPGDKVALLMHQQLATGFGKLGQGMLRYSEADIVAVIDCEHAGGDSGALTGIARDVPIVGTVAEARSLGAEILVIGIAPPGGRLPDEWWEEIKESLRLGMSVVNPLHGTWANNPELAPLVQPGKWIWDVRVEPHGLSPGVGAAASLKCKRVLTVGTDMSVGKMTASLELCKALKARGLRAKFVATGQVGICVAGDGVPLDAVRLDYATGVIEREVVSAGGYDVVVVEGQGALCHPASTATLALMRGAMPTHLLFVHRARQETLRRMPHFTIPQLKELIALNEDLASCNGIFPRPVTLGVALNCSELSEAEARDEIIRLQAEVGVEVSDPIKFGCEPLLYGLL